MPCQGTEFDELLPGQMSRQSREGRVAHISPHDELVDAPYQGALPLGEPLCLRTGEYLLLQSGVQSA